MKKFLGKYRIPSARAGWWDYGNDGAYFITICTTGRECFFGDTVDDVMKLSHVGVVADILIYEIKNHAKNVIVDKYVVMPNHVHLILLLNGNLQNANELIYNPGIDLKGTNDIIALDDLDGAVETYNMVGANRTDHVDGSYVETTHALSLQQNHQYPQNPQYQRQNQHPEEIRNSPGHERFQNQGKSTISSIVGSYKSAVTKHARRLGYDFGWQPRFHDIIIRNQESYYHISEYIINNPAKWEDDKFHPGKPDMAT